MFTLMLAAPLVVVVTAARSGGSSSQTTETIIDYQIPAESTSEALVIDLHGGGTLDFSQLQIIPIDDGNDDDDGGVVRSALHAAIITLGGETATDSNEDIRSSAYLGALGTDGTYYVCCSEAAVQAGACEEDEDEDDLGQLILMPSADSSNNVDVRTFGGGDMEHTTNVRFSKTSHAALVFGNCQPKTTMRISGTVTWTSDVTVGMLPIYTLMTVFYAGLCLWYGQLMNKNKNSRINIENWIVFTVVLATLNATFETVNFTAELYGTKEIMFFKMTSLLLALTRHSVTRCLYLVLSLGLGVATASLSRIITFLVAVFLTTDLILLWAMHIAYFMNIRIDIPYSLQLVIAMELIFTFWIPIALLHTMYKLHKNEEHAKLIRYKWFMAIYFLTATLSFVESMLYGEGRFNRSTLREANDLITLVPLVCVAVLWRPNPNQQMYSYVLLEDDKEDDLELTETVDDGIVEEDRKQIV